MWKSAQSNRIRQKRLAFLCRNNILRINIDFKHKRVSLTGSTAVSGASFKGKHLETSIILIKQKYDKSVTKSSLAVKPWRSAAFKPFKTKHLKKYLKKKPLNQDFYLLRKTLFTKEAVETTVSTKVCFVVFFSSFINL